MAEATISTILGDRVQDGDYRDSLPVNMFTVQREIKGSKGYLISHHGLMLHAEGSGVDRGGVWSQRFNRHYRVSANQFIEVSADGTVTNIGPVPGSQQINFAQSFNNIAFITDDVEEVNGEETAITRLYYYNPTDGLREITDSDVGNPIDITYINGVFFLTDGENVYHSDIQNEESYEALAFATAEVLPDRTVAVERTPSNEVVAFGRYSTEFFVSNPAAATNTFSFRRIEGRATKLGIVGVNCQEEMDGVFFILGGRIEESPSVYTFAGGSSKNISTREIDKIIATYTEEELALTSIEARVEDRDKFIYIHLPRQTLLYNHTIAQSLGTAASWTILKTSVVTDDPWLGRNFVFDPRIGKWICGDRFDNRIGMLDNTISTIYGEDIESIFDTKQVVMNGASVNEIELKTISGFTDERANVAISLSYDGETYGDEYHQLYGDKNQRDQRFILYRLGHVSNVVSFRFRIVSSSRLAFGSLVINYD